MSLSIWNIASSAIEAIMIFGIVEFCILDWCTHYPYTYVDTSSKIQLLEKLLEKITQPLMSKKKKNASYHPFQEEDLFLVFLEFRLQKLLYM